MGVHFGMVDVVVVGEVKPLVHIEEGEHGRLIPLPATGTEAQRPVKQRDEGERLPDF